MLVVVNARFLTQKVTGVQRFAMEICLQLKTMLKEVEFVTPSDVIQKEAFRELNAKIGRWPANFDPFYSAPLF